MNSPYSIKQSCYLAAKLFSLCSLVALTAMACRDPGSLSQPTWNQDSKTDNNPLHDADFLFDTSRLIDISIDVDPSDWDIIRKQRRDFGQAMLDPNAKPFSYVKADITIDGKKISGVGIRKKGFIGSLDDDFPSLKVKFNEYEKQNPFQGIDRLTLNNNKQDPTLLSQYLTYQLFNKVGIHASRVGFAKVTVNGKYLGVYSNVESVEKPFLKSRYQDDTGVLVEGALADFSPKSLDRFEFKSKAKDKKEADGIETLAKTLENPESLDLEDLEKIIEVDEFLRFWCTESLIGFWDGYASNQNNYFVYQSPKDKKLHFMPWGADGAWMGMSMPFGGFGGQSDAIYANSMLTYYLYQQESIPDRYAQTMKQILKEHWNEEELDAEIDRLVNLLEPQLHARQKFAMKPSVETLRNFVKGRRSTVERALSKKLNIPNKARRPMYASERGKATGKFNVQWKVKHKKGDPVNVSDLEIVVDDQPLKLKDVYATADEMARPQFGFGPNMGEWVPPAMITISGLRTDNKRRISLTLMFDKSSLAATPGEFDVTGSYSDGEGGGGFGPFGGFGQVSVRGKIKLASGGTDEGDAIEGEMDLRLMQIKGGFLDQR